MPREASSRKPRVFSVAYGEAPQQFAELRIPLGDGLFPVVALLHGGCWREFADLSYMTPLATALTEQGYATWNVEYRRAHEPGGGWPGTFDDAERGVNALRDAAQDYPLEIHRVVIMGHSAGGQLALYTGARLNWPAISLAGIVDMRAYFEHGPRDCVAGEIKVMGGTPDEYPERYAKVSPAELLPLGIRHVLIWGEQDDIVPESMFGDYEQRASGVEIVRVPGARHHDFALPQGPAWAAILSAVARLTSAT